MSKPVTIHYDGSDFPIGATCGECAHEHGIDPVTEENLDTVPHSKFGYCLTTHCPQCHHVDPAEPTPFASLS